MATIQSRVIIAFLTLDDPTNVFPGIDDIAEKVKNAFSASGGLLNSRGPTCVNCGIRNWRSATIHSYPTRR